MITHGLTLVALWILLWGRFTPGNVLNGVIIAAVLTWLFPVRGFGLRRVRPLGALRLLGYVLWSLVKSTAQVFLAVLFPSPERVETRVIPVQLTTRSPMVASIVGNLITLTPGTMTVDADRESCVLDVHVLGRVDDEEFARSILELESVVLGAVIPVERR
jgi:multicomponent Na+:H+ antiporter subunit E